MIKIKMTILFLTLVVLLPAMIACGTLIPLDSSKSSKVKRETAIDWPSGFNRRHSLVERSHSKSFNPGFRKSNFMDKEETAGRGNLEVERMPYDQNAVLAAQPVQEIKKQPNSNEDYRNGHSLRAFVNSGGKENSKSRAKKTSGSASYKGGLEKEGSHSRSLVDYPLMDSAMEAKNIAEEAAVYQDAGNENGRSKTQSLAGGPPGKSLEAENRAKKTPLKREDSDGIRKDLRKQAGYFKNSPRHLGNTRRRHSRLGGAADFSNGYDGPETKMVPSAKNIEADAPMPPNSGIILMNGENGLEFDYHNPEGKEPQNFRPFAAGRKSDQSRSTHDSEFFENEQDKFLEDRFGGIEKPGYYHGGIPRSLDKLHQDSMYYDPVDIEKRGDDSSFVEYSHLVPEESYPMLYQRNGQPFQENVSHGRRWKRNLDVKKSVSEDLPVRERRKQDREESAPKSSLCLQDLGPDNFFCPGEPSYLNNRTEIQYSAKDTEAMHWNGHGLVFAPDQVGGEKQCLVLNVIGDTYVTLYGWKVKGYKLPCPLQKKHKVTGGLVKAYNVRYMVTTGKWSYINDGKLPRVFMSEGDLKNPDAETQEMLMIPIDLAALQFCPLSTEGATPVLYVELVGCRLYPKDEFSRLYFDSHYTEPYTCANHMEWAGEDLIFESNSGIKADAAGFSSAGFTFTSLPQLAVGANTEYYLEAKMVAPSIIFRLRVSGSAYSVSQGMVASFTLAYMDLSNVWRYVLDGGEAAKVFDTGLGHSSINSDQVVVLTLPRPTVARSLRIFPQTWRGLSITMRLDVEYCDIFPVDDREVECKVPYNLISRAILNDRTIETLITEESVSLEDPHGYLFQLKKSSRWNNHESYVRATFPEHLPRKVTCLVLEGGSTPDGRTGLVTDFTLRHGVTLPVNQLTSQPPVASLTTSSPPYDQHPHQQGQQASTPPTTEPSTVPLSIANANAIIKNDKPEETRYVFLFKPALVVRFIEIYPQNWRYNPILRFGLRGCHAGGHPYPVKYFHPESNTETSCLSHNTTAA